MVSHKRVTFAHRWRDRPAPSAGEEMTIQSIRVIILIVAVAILLWRRLAGRL